MSGATMLTLIADDAAFISRSAAMAEPTVKEERRHASHEARLSFSSQKRDLFAARLRPLRRRGRAASLKKRVIGGFHAQPPASTGRSRHTAQRARSRHGLASKGRFAEDFGCILDDDVMPSVGVKADAFR